MFLKNFHIFINKWALLQKNLLCMWRHYPTVTTLPDLTVLFCWQSMWKIITGFRTYKSSHCDISFGVAEFLRKHLILHPANIFFFAGSQCEKSLQNSGPLRYWLTIEITTLRSLKAVASVWFRFRKLKSCRNACKVIQRRGPTWSISVPSVLNSSPQLRVSNNVWHYILEWNRIYVIFVQIFC